jgi:type I restriction enzyme S subunit
MTSENWKTVKFKDIMKLQRGFDLYKKDFKEGIYPVIGATSITGYHNEYKVKGPGVVTGRTGTLGNVLYIEKDFWPHQDALWTKDFKGNDPKYISYFLRTLNLEKFNAGGAVPALNRNHLDNLKILWPNVDTQNKIASILSTYDNLIENNNQRIKLLEEMAEEIYKEWLVRLRFPGYQDSKFFNKDGREVSYDTAGALPMGWMEKKFEELITLFSGFAFKSENFTKSPQKNIVVRMGNFKIKGGLKFDSNVKYLDDKVKLNDKYRLTKGDLVMVLSDVTRDGAIIGNVGLVPESSNNYYLNQRVSKLIFDENIKYYLYQYLNSVIFKNYCLAHADSATVLNLSNKDIYKHKLILPIEDIVNKFHNVIEPMITEVELLINKNQVLKETKDLLLPRLISGKLSVEDVNIENINSRIKPNTAEV